MKTVIYLIFLGLFVFVSCEEDIDVVLETDVSSMLVVEGSITNENKEHLIRITRSDNYFSNVGPIEASIQNSIIRELETGVEYPLVHVDTGTGYYKTPKFAGTIGYTYRLKVDFRGVTYQATSFLDTVPDLDSASYAYEYWDGFNFGFYQFKIFAQELPQPGNYYLFNLYLNDTIYNDKISQTSLTFDEFYNGIYLSNVDVYTLPQEEIMLDTNHVRIEILSISKQYYNFVNAFIIESQANGNIFSGPPADVPSNVISIDSAQTGLGHFGASAVSSYEYILYKAHHDSTNNPDY